MLVWTAFEYGRIHCAYVGNLKESFPELITFPFVNLLTIGAAVTTIISKPFELNWVLFYLYVIFCVLEIIYCIIEMCYLVRTKTALFYLQNPDQNVKITQQKREEMKFKQDLEAQKKKFRPESAIREDSIEDNDYGHRQVQFADKNRN